MKKLLQTLSQKWPEYLLEVLVLIFGIYGAFALENWREDRKEQQQLLTNISSIVKDLQADTTIIGEINEMLRRQVVAGEKLIPILESEARIITDSLDFILAFNHFSEMPVISIRNSTWDYLNSSGVATKLEDPQLIALLQDYYRTYAQLVENFNQSAISPRLEIRQLKYELFENSEHRKFFPTNTPIVPSASVYHSIFSDQRILPLCRFIGGGSAVYFLGEFEELELSAIEVLDYISTNYSQ